MNDLVLHAPTLDAEAAADLVRKARPGAEVVEREPVEDADAFVGTLRGMGAPGRTIVLLGILHPDDAPGSTLTGVYTVMATPDASIVMHVWRELYGGSECTLCEHAPRETCTEHCTPTTMTDDDAPWHVAYIDDAVCGRWALPDSRAVWAWMETLAPDGRQPWDYNRLNPSAQATGRAILRAQKRWEEDHAAELRIALRAAEIVAEESARLRTERDEAKAGLREALDLGSFPSNEIARVWLAGLRELAGVDGG